MSSRVKSTKKNGPRASRSTRISGGTLEQQKTRNHKSLPPPLQRHQSRNNNNNKSGRRRSRSTSKSSSSRRRYRSDVVDVGMIRKPQKVSDSSVCVNSVNGSRDHSQDTVAIVSFVDKPDITKYGGIFVVCDGHGKVGGEHASRIAAEVLINELRLYDSSHHFTASIFNKAFKKAHDAVLEAYPTIFPGVQKHEVSQYFPNAFKTPQPPAKTPTHFYADFSKRRLVLEEIGTTASVVVWQPELDRLTCAHVGDSELFVLVESSSSSSQTRSKEKTAVQVIELCKPHHVTNIQERKRLEALQKQLAPNGPVRTRFVGHRYHIQFHIRGLFITEDLEPVRCIGHNICTCFGIDITPQIDVIQIPASKQIKAIILGSDGLWEVFQKNNVQHAQIVQSVRRAFNAEEYAMMLLAWVEHVRQKKSCDNTCVAVYLRPSSLTN